MTIAQTIILGIISSIVASLVFYLLVILIKPNFDVSSEISTTDISDDTIRCKIKVVNRSRSILTNISYSLVYCIEGQDGIKDYNTIKPAKKALTFIRQYQEDNSDYAVRLSFDINKNKYPLSKDVTFIFTFQATHSFSNSIRIKQCKYKVDNMINGLFETGLSTKIILRTR